MRGIRALVVLPWLAACQRAVAPAAAAPLPVTPPAATYVADLSGVSFGEAFATAAADGAPSGETRPSAADQPTDAAASRDGDELQRSCGSDGVQSHAQAAAAFQPRSVGGGHQLGFALSTTSYATGGFWRDRHVLCRGAHETMAVADARAVGRIDLTFNANGGTSEQLILRVSGATPQEAHLEVRDAQDHVLPLSPVPGEASLAATLDRPGFYRVHASIASHAEGAGATAPGARRAATFAVSVQSRRDAVALGYGQAPTNALMLPLPVFVSADALTAALDSALFTDQHRLYPCAKVECGTSRLRDVYLDAPRVSMQGGAIVLDMHLSGTYQLALDFGRGISGTIRAMAVPVVEHDTLRFESPSVDVATHSLILAWRSASFEQRLLDRIRNVRIDLAPELRATVARAQEQLSRGWGGACLLLSPSVAHLRAVRVVTTAPPGIVANFEIELAEASDSRCSGRRTLR